jgi:hypothetical protein
VRSADNCEDQTDLNGQRNESDACHVLAVSSFVQMFAAPRNMHDHLQAVVQIIVPSIRYKATAWVPQSPCHDQPRLKGTPGHAGQSGCCENADQTRRWVPD